MTKIATLIVILLNLSYCSLAQDTTIVDDDDMKIFSRVETEAFFPGGTEGWKRYLQNSLNPEIPVNNGAPTGTYQVIIQFIVRKDGSISDARATTNHGFGMEQEVIKIIMNGPKWIPAYQNGRPVNAYRRQPVTFVVIEEPRKSRRRRDQ